MTSLENGRESLWDTNRFNGLVDFSKLLLV